MPLSRSFQPSCSTKGACAGLLWLAAAARQCLSAPPHSLVGLCYWHPQVSRLTSMLHSMFCRNLAMYSQRPSTNLLQSDSQGQRFPRSPAHDEPSRGDKSQARGPAGYAGSLCLLYRSLLQRVAAGGLATVKLNCQGGGQAPGRVDGVLPRMTCLATHRHALALSCAICGSIDK